MELIEPKVELLSELDITPESHIARCARVCYGKEYKEPNQVADEKMADGLVNREHLSMFRHASAYISTDDISEELESHIYNSSYWGYSQLHGCASTNLQELKCNGVVYESITLIGNKQFLEKCVKYPNLFKIYRLTFCITTQISTSRELNRVSPNAIAERSTRYCVSKDGIVICRPWWSKSSEEDIYDRHGSLDELLYYNNAILESERIYKTLLNLGMKPEDARGVLPLDTATKVIYTYSVQEWQHILDLRLYDKTGKAHPNCHVVMQMVKEQINSFAKEHNIDYQV